MVRQMSGGKHSRTLGRILSVLSICFGTACTPARLVELPVEDPPLIWLGDREYRAGLSAVMLQVADADIVGPIGSFTTSGPPLQDLASDTAYQIRGLDPSRYLAYKVEPATAVEVGGGSDGQWREEFQTTGWVVAYAPGSLPDPAICPYLREKWRPSLGC